MKYDFKPNLQRELTPETSQAISQGIDNLSGYMSAAGTSRKERKWQEKWYATQRADRHADWMLQNQYNSPAAQMQRLKAAGLNPNLVYGNGATATGGSIDAPSGPSANFPVPPTGNGNAVGNYMMVKMQDAQLQNVYAQNDLIHAQIRNLDSNALNRGIDTAQKSFKLGLDREDRPNEVQRRQAVTDKLLNEISATANEDTRRTILQESTIVKMAEETLNLTAVREKLQPAMIEEIRQRIKQMQQEGRLKQWDEYIQSVGGNRNGMKLWNAIIQIIAGAAGDGFVPPIK